MQPLHRQWIIWYAISLHGVWGVLILLDPHAGFGTALFRARAWVPDHTGLGAALIGVALLAALGACRGQQRGGLALLLPQQGMLMLSAFGAVTAITQGRFPDGVVRPSAFIACDQLPALLAAGYHTAALLEVHAVGLWRRRT